MELLFCYCMVATFTLPHTEPSLMVAVRLIWYVVAYLWAKIIASRLKKLQNSMRLRLAETVRRKDNFNRTSLIELQILNCFTAVCNDRPFDSGRLYGTQTKPKDRWSDPASTVEYASIVHFTSMISFQKEPKAECLEVDFLIVCACGDRWSRG